jgi:hypothetical protein
MSRMTIPTDFSKQSSANFVPIPADNHLGVLIGITDLGTHMESFQGGTPAAKRKVRLQFELPNVKRPDGSTATISKEYTYSFHEKANFRKLLDTWLGADWTGKHKGENLGFLLNMPAMVQVEQVPARENPEEKISLIQSIGKVPSFAPKVEPTRDTFFLDLDDRHLPATLSLKDAEKIRQSHEYKAGGFRDEARRPGQTYGNGSGQTATATAGPAMGKAAPPVDDDMSDVPFADPDPVRFLPPSMAREERMRRFESTDIC